MTYLATIKYPHTTHSMLFKSITEAEQWLDSKNNNMQYTTLIEEFNERWEKVSGFFYTEAKR